MDFSRFTMIDKVIALNKEQKSIICATQLPATSSIFDAHFPGSPILPGVFMIETIAQAAGLLFMGLDGFKKMPILYGVEEARFRQIAKPAEHLTVKVNLLHHGSGYIVCAGEIDRQESEANIATAQVRLKLIDIFTQETEQLLRERCMAVQLAV